MRTELITHNSSVWLQEESIKTPLHPALTSLLFSLFSKAGAVSSGFLYAVLLPKLTSFLVSVFLGRSTTSGFCNVVLQPKLNPLLVSLVS